MWVVAIRASGLIGMGLGSAIMIMSVPALCSLVTMRSILFVTVVMSTVRCSMLLSFVSTLVMLGASVIVVLSWFLCIWCASLLCMVRFA